MKKLFGIVLFLSLFVFIFTYLPLNRKDKVMDKSENVIVEGERKHQLEDFYGVYRGLAPTDESPIVCGEIEISIDKEKVNIRMASGLKVLEDEFTTSSLIPISEEESRKLWIDGSERNNFYVAFSMGVVKWLFYNGDSNDEFGLIITGDDLSGIFGPTVLFNPKQIEAGKWDEIKKELKGKLPLIENDGKFVKLSFM